MKFIFKKIISLIYLIWSYSPFISLTNDDNFGTMEYKTSFKSNIKHPRLSLFNVMLGSKALYIITFDIKQKKLEMFKYINLDDLYLLTDDEITSISNRYKFYLDQKNSLDEGDIEIEKEALLYHIGNEEKRLDKSSEKINIYTTIILTVIPIMLAIIKIDTLTSLNVCEKIIAGLIAYCLFNITLYVFQSLKIQSIMKSRFGDLKKSENHIIEINLQYQFDWQYLIKKANLFVSYVKNIQYWLVGILFLSFILAIIISCNDYKESLHIQANSNYDEVISISINDLNNPYSESTIALTELNLSIQKKDIKKVILISNSKLVSNKLKDNMINTYYDLIIKTVIDNTVNDDIIKIIQED